MSKIKRILAVLLSLLIIFSSLTPVSAQVSNELLKHRPKIKIEQWIKNYLYLKNNYLLLTELMNDYISYIRSENIAKKIKNAELTQQAITLIDALSPIELLDLNDLSKVEMTRRTVFSIGVQGGDESNIPNLGTLEEAESKMIDLLSSNNLQVESINYIDETSVKINFNRRLTSSDIDLLNVLTDYGYGMSYNINEPAVLKFRVDSLDEQTQYPLTYGGYINYIYLTIIDFEDK